MKKYFLIIICTLLFSCDNPFVMAITDPMFGFMVESPSDWNNAINAIRYGVNGGSTPKEYTITVKGTVNVAGGTNDVFTFGNANNIKVTMRGKGTLRLNSEGNLIRIEGNQTLVIDGPTLQGLNPNNTANASLVYVNSDATLELKSGSITGNTVSSNACTGVGVYVNNGGTFIMSGGTINNNHAIATSANAHGGGVFVAGTGTFIMNGGTINNNSATASGDAHGGGVSVSGNFTMNGGIINNNSATASSNAYGGDVYVDSSANYSKNGGTIGVLYSAP